MKRKGISLIVLIITVVVIIILATTIIINIAKTNIIENANESVLKSNVGNLKTELEMYILDEFVENKGEYDRNKLNADIGQAKYNEKNIEDSNDDGKINIYDILTSLKGSNLDEAVYIQEGKIIFIKSKLNTSQIKLLTKMGEEVDGTPRITDVTSERDFTSITVSAVVTIPEEVEKYVYIINDGEEIESTESTKTFEGLTANTKYTIRIRAILKDGTEIETIKETSTLDNTPPIEPVIESFYGYPTLTEYGIVNGEETIITYDTSEGVINQYSLNSGATWNEYKGSFNINEACTIMAKSIKPNGLESSVTKEITIPSDILGGDAYDEDETSFVEYGVGVNKYLKISPEIIGKYIRINAKIGGFSTAYLIFEKEDHTENHSIQLHKNTDGSTVTINENYIIPEETVYVKLYISDRYNGNVNPTIKFYDIKLVNEPTFNERKIYPILTENGVVDGYNLVSINYFYTSQQKKYKINDGEWQTYNNGEIKLNIGDILYAKGIDKNGTETRVTSEYNSILPSDALIEASYNNDSTSFDEYALNINRYLQVSPEMIGKYIKIDATIGGFAEAYLIFEKEDHTENDSIKLHDKGNRSAVRVTNNYLIPEDTVYVKVYISERINTTVNPTVKLYEVGVGQEE